MRIYIALGLCTAIACTAAPQSSPAPQPTGRGALACDFTPGEEESDHVARCADRLPDGRVVVRHDALFNRSLRPEGVAEVMIAGNLFFVSRAGNTASALVFDNGADYFVEGLARTTRNGQVGFVDADLREVISPQWDFAFPFEGGAAMVCQGCVSVPIHPGAEYHEMVGGKWGYIDKSGRPVVPVAFERDRVPAPAGFAQGESPANPALQPPAAKPAAAER